MRGLIALCASSMLVGCTHGYIALPSEAAFEACWDRAAAIYDPDDPMQAYGRYTVIGECLRGKSDTQSAFRP